MKIIEEDGIRVSNFSVILRAKNEGDWIGHCIQSLLDNIKNPEIIILDNESSDDTLQIVKAFKKNKKLDSKNFNYTNIKIYTIKDYTPGRSINFGVKKSANENIIIISAHCILKKFPINSILNNLKKYKGIFGNQIPIWKGKKISKRYIWSNFTNKKVINMFSKQEERYFFHNAASVFKKSTLKKIPFDEELSGKEDRYWANKIVNSKMKYLYDPGFVVDHHYTVNGATWKGLG